MHSAPRGVCNLLRQQRRCERWGCSCAGLQQIVLLHPEKSLNIKPLRVLRWDIFNWSCYLHEKSSCFEIKPFTLFQIKMECSAGAETCFPSFSKLTIQFSMWKWLFMSLFATCNAWKKRNNWNEGLWILLKQNRLKLWQKYFELGTEICRYFQCLRSPSDC